MKKEDLDFGFEDREAGDEITSETRDLNNQEKKEAPSTITRPMESVSQPIFSRDERVALTLLPLASALLQGKAPGGQSLLSSTLATAGQGLAGSGNVALRIRELEGQRQKEGQDRKEYVLQPNAGPVEIQGEVITPDMGRILNLPANVVSQYPVDTFMLRQDTEKRKLQPVKGDFAYYMSEQDALKKFPVEQYGDFYKRVTASDDNNIGDAVLGANQQAMQYQTNFIGQQPQSVTLVPSVSTVPQRDIIDQALPFMTKSQAIEFLKKFGADENTPGFNQIIKLMSTAEGRPIEEGSRFIGRPVVFGDRLQNMVITKRGNEIESLTNKTGDVPEYIKDYKKFREGTLNKFQATDNSRRNIARQLAIFGQQLLNGELKTGAIQKFTLPVRNFLAALPGSRTSSEELANISNQQFFTSFLGQVAGTFRVPGSGSTSDREFAAFVGAIGDLGKLPEGQYMNMYFVRANFKREREANKIRATMLKGGYSEAEIDNAITKMLEKPIGRVIPERYINDPEGLAEWYEKDVKKGELITNSDLEGNAIIPNFPTIHVKGFREFEVK